MKVDILLNADQLWRFHTEVSYLNFDESALIITTTVEMKIDSIIKPIIPPSNLLILKSTTSIESLSTQVSHLFFVNQYVYLHDI